MIDTITIDELKIGMYVVDVICSDKNFKVKTQGLVKSKKTIDILKKQGVTSVTVEYDIPDETTDNDSKDAALSDSNQNNIPPKSQPIKIKSIEDEFSRSCIIYGAATENIKNLFTCASLEQGVNTNAINDLASEITESVIRNEYAMAILTRIRNKSSYQWEHAINCAVLLCGFSLYLGLKKETTILITLGAMLHDIGIAVVPKGVIEKPGKFTKNDMDVMKKHLKWGQEIYKKNGIPQKIVLDMIINHHERLDGSGYPRGLDETNLSKLAKMSAIVDVYDAMTGDKVYKQGEQPINALRYLIAKNDKFDRGLVQQFIKYIGVHPVGSLVKLSNETLAIVIQGNRENPLNPVVKVFYNMKHRSYITSKKYDLTKGDVSIIESSRPEEYDINLSKVIREILG